MSTDPTYHQDQNNFGGHFFFYGFSDETCFSFNWIGLQGVISNRNLGLFMLCIFIQPFYSTWDLKKKYSLIDLYCIF